MSENVHTQLHEANERHEQIAGHGNRLVPLAAAIIAVLAALGTLFTHHRSILALTAKNEAILAQARASDRYNSYEAKRVRYNLYSALITAGLPQSAAGKKAMQEVADREQESSLAALAKAEVFDRKSQEDEERAGRMLHSYETLEIGTTFFEIAIVLVSISALTRTPVFLTVGCGLSALGMAFIAVGYFQGH